MITSSSMCQRLSRWAPGTRKSGSREGSGRLGDGLGVAALTEREGRAWLGLERGGNRLVVDRVGRGRGRSPAKGSELSIAAQMPAARKNSTIPKQPDKSSQEDDRARPGLREDDRRKDVAWVEQGLSISPDEG